MPPIASFATACRRGGCTARPADTDQWLITCEHGGNRIPAAYRELFAGQRELLHSHRGYDPGALAMARELAHRLQAPLIVASTSRLLVDLNRSPGHPKLYSETIRRAPRALRDEVLARHYLPYRLRAESLVATAVAAGRRVVHVSSHSFTPVLNGEVRNTDIGLLYDPGRPGEVALCRRWLVELARAMPGVRVRRNYPYTGKSDGFCSWLRRRFPPEAYVGLELEINQKHVRAGSDAWAEMRRGVAAALLAAVMEGAEQTTRTASQTGFHPPPEKLP